ncbi:heat shock protein Hsp20 [Segniliparus rotundus DSM 44985]|uniref:Heat shock protein Hsp20 n=1 Tax=Segniliparus rotundus (strain ATCC BAA-972 / CDC 1076 / CIP 108378 / DSM 44985 / JCM 13578) TaxID=640132 RepID=D6ZC92_SEGRD|nr:Hsp20/alpha crystallin family protein [Segniliparus rotundus]ADG99061.1 heat shock protein Hsp20 [Segniliparus rotundus DSM 44985]
MSNMTVWTRRNPFAEFDALVRNAFGPTESWPTETAFTPATEIVRDGDDALVRLDLPGVDVENDVTVEVHDGQLVVRGERKSEHSEEHEGQSMREVRYGSFRRTFKLPTRSTSDDISANYDCGVLTVRVAGAHKSIEPQRISVGRQAQRAAVDGQTAPEQPAVESAE